MGVDARMRVDFKNNLVFGHFGAWLASEQRHLKSDFPGTCFYLDEERHEKVEGCISLYIGGLGRYPVGRNDISIKPDVVLAQWLENRYEGCRIFYGSDHCLRLKPFDKDRRDALLEEEREQNEYPPTDQEQKMLDHLAKTAMVELLRKFESLEDVESIPALAWGLAHHMLEERRKRLEDY